MANKKQEFINSLQRLNKNDLCNLLWKVQRDKDDLFVSQLNFIKWLQIQIDGFTSELMQFNDYNEGVKHCLGCVARACNLYFGSDLEDIDSVENNILNFKLITNDNDKNKKA